ncbi:MAG: hypothetical protein HQL38_18315 [Alphaproteobacteria bacterium]|nr:hypothetical protein [Alphaproteobacteria bacterium]MBF0394635.1 hypothetical protein [Alphaproteobacteria bacterium]
MEAILHSRMNIRSQVMAALSYVGVLCFVPLVLARDDEFVVFHARQGLVLWIGSMLALFALHVPVLGKWVFGFASMTILAVSVIGLVSVLMQRAWKLPVIGWIAERI